MFSERSTICPGATLMGICAEETAPICSPLKKAIRYEFVQVHEPTFLKRHVFVNGVPAAITVPGDTLISAINSALSQALGAIVGVAVASMTASPVAAVPIAVRRSVPSETRAVQPTTA